MNPERIGQITVASQRGTVISRPERATLDIPPILLACPLIQRILATPCYVSLTDARYHLIESNRTQTLSPAEERPRPRRQPNRPGFITSTLQYSLLVSILTEMAKQQPGQVCITGHIEIRLQGSFSSARQQVWPDRPGQPLSRIYFGLTPGRVAQCRANRLVYIPVSMQWSRTPTVECNGCVGHATALLIDNSEKTIQLYDPNGTNAPYFAAAEQWLRHQFARRGLFSSYTFMQSASIPRFGYQIGTDLQMCAYFSALYVAIRIHCPSIAAQDVNDALERIPKPDIRRVLSLFHCYLLDQGRPVFEAARRLSSLHSGVYTRYLRAPTEQERTRYEGVLKHVQQVVQTDLVEAVALLESA